MRALRWVPGFDFGDYTNSREIEHVASVRAARMRSENDERERAIRGGPIESAIFPERRKS